MNYQLANLIINTFIAIGTVGAVVFSLWYTVLSRREKAKVYVSSTITAGYQALYVNITIINSGVIDFRLSHMYVHLNDLIIMPMPKDFFVPLPDDKIINPPGSRVSCYLHMFSFDSFVNNKQSVTPEQTKQILGKGFITLYTSRGTVFKTRFSKSFIKHYYDYRLSEQQTNK